MSKNVFLYYAYGSNLSMKRLHINNPSAVRAGIAKLENYRLDFFKHSKVWGGCSATIAPHEGFHVWGALWEISLDHLPNLDRQEGVQDGVYFRFEVEVMLENGLKKTCMVYQQVNNPKDYYKLKDLPLNRRPSPVYMETIIAGAEESRLPEEHMKLLKKVPRNSFDGVVDLNLDRNVSHGKA